MGRMTQKRAEMIVNSVQSAAERFRVENYSMPGFDAKHGNTYGEFGLPLKLTFNDKFFMYQRNGFASGAINLLINKVWQSNPEIVQGTEDGKNKTESAIEKEIRQFCKRTKLWKSMRAADLRRSIGMYSALIVELVDDDNWSQPLDNLRPEQIKCFTPVWENQLTIS